MPPAPAPSHVRVLDPPAGRGLPVEVRPAGPGVGLADWAAANAGTVQAWLLSSGAVLFRGFGVTLEDFAGVTMTLAGEPTRYTERSSPRTLLGDHVYTATDHPADQLIPLHNENSYQASFPAAVLFCCVHPSAEGGATTLADTRRVLARLPADLLAPFAEHGVLYQRNFSGGLGLPWQEVFQTSSRQVVTEYCRSRGIAARWLSDGGLRTRQARPALAAHPLTGELVWLNHGLFFNAHNLPAQVGDSLRTQLAEEDLPAHTYYGDGRPIPAAVLRALSAAYAAEEVAVRWAAGDVLLVDNMLAAHGRQPYAGSRQVVVTMTGNVEWSAVDASGAVTP